ncbi:MAG: alpha/beta fold hydrolase [Chloroflexi bacterium]|nr:alpha/beta fold hydrolase [Chloroflexota bacterium]
MRVKEQFVLVQAGEAALEGILSLVEGAKGLILFAHGSGSSRHSPRNRFVAQRLHERGFSTLLFDLLTAEEDRIDRLTRNLRFDIGLLTERLVHTTDWVLEQPEAKGLKIGYFGASTGAAAALIAAAQRPEIVSAIVSRGGRPDLASAALPQVRAPTLLIVGGRDYQVLELNRQAKAQMRVTCTLSIVEGATHLFEEPGALERVAELAGDWFIRYIGAPDIVVRKDVNDD